MNNRLFETKNLCRHYIRGTYTVKAVDEVSLSINKGDYTAIVGSSGSGKSTILNLLAGLDTPTSGEIYAEGNKLSDFSRRQFAQYRAKKIGMIFQSFNLIPHYTALRNVEMALYFDDTPKSERTAKAEAMLASVGLSDRLDHRPADMSGGEQQRVAVARALVKEPEVLFADEPTGNLDLENSQQIASLLKDLHDKGITVIMVTHDMSLAENSAQRIIRMHYGKIVNGETA
ncbi:MAG: ABC transporter ATP-binding protein [Calditrichaeota bacterium]|nr:MAG: ABC transporter ATP-binding protein [Calditrichota bacterium]